MALQIRKNSPLIPNEIKYLHQMRAPQLSKMGLTAALNDAGGEFSGGEMFGDRERPWMHAGLGWQYAAGAH
jgi:hypothetical protein